MMFQKGRFRIKETENTKVLEIPYADKNLSMFIILPDRKDGIKKLQNVLTTVMLSEMLAEAEEVDAEIYIPKFKISYGTVDLTENFKKLGMNDAFDKRADFSGMTGNKELFISGILHKAFIELNEEGAEAAAATAVVMGFKSAKTEKPFAFKADHPFIFVLRENSTGSILFMGTIVKP
jgi:serpin B